MPTKRPPKPVEPSKPEVTLQKAVQSSQRVPRAKENKDDNAGPFIIGAVALGLGIILLSSKGAAAPPSPPNRFIITLTGKGDCLSPTTPIVRLAWNALPGASLYDILRDGTIVDTTNGSATSWISTSLGPNDDGVPHQYQVIGQINLLAEHLKIYSNIITVISGCHAPPAANVVISAINGFFI